MEKLYFDDICDIANFMVENADDGKDVCAVFHYNEAVELLRELILLVNDYDILAIELQPEDWDGYDKEYYISLNKICGLCVEPAFRWGKYLGTAADIMLVAPDANSKIITCPTSDVEMMFEVSFDKLDCEKYKQHSTNNEIAELVKEIFGIFPSHVEVKTNGDSFKIRAVID